MVLPEQTPAFTAANLSTHEMPSDNRLGTSSIELTPWLYREMTLIWTETTWVEATCKGEKCCEQFHSRKFSIEASAMNFRANFFGEWALIIFSNFP